MKISGRIEGLDGILRATRSLKQGARNRVTRRMVNVGSTPILKAAKSKAPRRNGILAKSLGRKTKTYANGAVVGVIGPRVGYRQQVGVKADGTPRYEDPAKIAHLVEFGHGGPHPAPPHPFMRPAFDESKGSAKAQMLRAGAEALESEARKAASRK